MQYEIGNPLIAETMLKYELRTAFNVPPRVLILERDNGATDLIYHLPSSVIAITDNAKLKEAAEILDAKLELMLTKVASADNTPL